MNEKETLSLSMRELMPFVEEELAAGKEAVLTVKGYSMDPFLVHNRDKVYLTALNGTPLRKGDVVMFCREDGSYAMHRIYKIRADGSMDIVGDSQYICDAGVTPSMIKAYVPKVIRKGKTISCEKGLWRFWMVRYMNLRMRCPRFTKHVMRLCNKLYRFAHH